MVVRDNEGIRTLTAKAVVLACGGFETNPAWRAHYLERLAEMEPLDADVQRDLIAAWLRQGRRTRAMRRYRMVQSRLMREFGERVTFDLPGLGNDAPG